MLSVEDCLEALEESTWYNAHTGLPDATEITNNWDRRFISDVSNFTLSGKALSTAQGTIALKLIERYRSILERKGIKSSSIDILLSQPHYRLPPYQSTILKREVRWIGNNKLVFRLKKNPGIIEDIKRLKGTNYFIPSGFPMFNRQHSMWLVDVNSGNLSQVMDVIKRHRFEFDDDVAQYFMEVSNAMGQQSTAHIENNSIDVTVKDDDFLDSWLNAIGCLEN